MGQVLRNFPVLLEDDGADSSFRWTFNGTKGVVQIVGTWDGATVVVQVSIDGGVTFKTDANFSMTEDDIKYLSNVTPGGGLYQFFVSGAGASTALIPTLVQDSK